MKKLGLLVTAAAMVAFAGGAMAGSASKFAASVEGTSLIAPVMDGAPASAILDIDIKTANKSDLLIGVSMETSLITATKAKGKNGGSDSENATAGVEVCVLIDESTSLLLPHCVTFEKRSQTLNTVLGGVIESCEDTGDWSIVEEVCVDAGGGPDGIITVECECIVTDEEIELILNTTSANHFNFVARNLSSGDHTVKVTATGTTSVSGSDSTATVAVGSASLTVEQVRAVNDGSGIEFK